MNPSGFYVDPLFSYIDLLNYMLKYKIPQIVTLTPKIKAFRSQLRGVADLKFFMFRLARLYA